MPPQATPRRLPAPRPQDAPAPRHQPSPRLLPQALTRHPPPASNSRPQALQGSWRPLRASQAGFRSLLPKRKPLQAPACQRAPSHTAPNGQPPLPGLPLPAWPACCSAPENRTRRTCYDDPAQARSPRALTQPRNGSGLSVSLHRPRLQKTPLPQSQQLPSHARRPLKPTAPPAGALDRPAAQAPVPVT